MAAKNLEEALKAAGDPVEMLRNSQIGAYIYPVVPPEYTNWRDEQRAWRETVVLCDQSHHMAEMMVEGPDAVKLLSKLSVNSFAGFVPDKAKQMVAVSHDGYVIGDGILFYLAENQFNFVGREPIVNWIQFNAETGGYDVKVSRDDRSPGNPNGKAVNRRHYRYQLQGPNAWALLEKLNGAPIPQIKFFNMGTFKIGGKTIRGLRHGMAGAPGLEFWGPYEERDEVRNAILEAGKEFGLAQLGSRSYSSITLESGWIPSPLPAVYTGDKMRPYREWLGPARYEVAGSLGGSFVSGNIEDYYVRPEEIGYGHFVKFDHDFIGREALEALGGKAQRKKVTFAWNNEDVAKVLGSVTAGPGKGFKYIETPLSNYASSMYDRIEMDGKVVGFSMFGGTSYNEGAMLSLGVVDSNIEIGDVLTLVWGEENGGTRKTTVERHVQTTIRVKVAPVPYAREAREEYAGSWRVRHG
ncbi:MAG TPA: aminomethyl transferase family protein [Caulobacteraceae bacterium]|jgi:vanillate/3-O-methylgallate O-demethylase|nr:aminomethyl transferase family protein [Caulobacteraceae bacterium]